MLLTLLITLAVFAISFLGPGLFCLRRVEMPAEERVTAAVGLSLLLVYLPTFLIFLLRLPVALCGSILFVCAVLTAAAGADLIRLLKIRDIQRMAAGFAALVLWSLVLVALIRNYSGDNWYGDWLEHYQRSLFFLDRPSSDTLFQGDYAVPARPPMMNVLCGTILAVSGKDFAVYQIVFTLLNVLIYFPACLLTRYFAGAGRSAYLALTAFLMFNPMVAQNATYSWTKLFAAFYVLTGIYFYLRGRHSEKYPWMLMAFTSLAAGIIAHYSAIPYALFLAGHYLGFVFPSRKDKWIEISGLTLVAALILGPWFGFTAATYGTRTFTSVLPTITVDPSATRSPAQTVVKVIVNIRNTLMPHLLRGVEIQGFGRDLFWGPVRDAAFKLYQFNLPFALGCLGWLVLAYGLYRATRKNSQRPVPDKTFWMGLLPFCFVFGIALQGTEYNLGLAHITLQPLVVLGLAFLAAGFGDWPRSVRWIALAGLLVDWAFGIVLHFWFQSLPFDGGAARSGGWAITSRDLLVGSVLANWKLKQTAGLSFLADHLLPQVWVIEAMGAIISLSVLILLARQTGSPTEKEKGTHAGSSKGAPKESGRRKHNPRR
jgi:hypothetical protein